MYEGIQENINITVGATLRNLRIAKGWTQEFVGSELEKEATLDFEFVKKTKQDSESNKGKKRYFSSTISKIENGTMSLTVAELHHYAKVFSVSMSYILGDTNCKLPSSDINLKNIVKTIIEGLLKLLPDDERKSTINELRFIKK